MWSNIVRYYVRNYRNWGRISMRCWIHKRHPIPRPNGRAMGVSFVDICKNIDCVITALHCIMDWIYIAMVIVEQKPQAVQPYQFTQGFYLLSGPTSYRKILWCLSLSCEIGCYNDRITLKFDRHLGSSAAEMPVTFQRDCKSLNPNLAASRLHKILR